MIQSSEGRYLRIFHYWSNSKIQVEECPLNTKKKIKHTYLKNQEMAEEIQPKWGKRSVDLTARITGWPEKDDGREWSRKKLPPHSLQPWYDSNPPKLPKFPILFGATPKVLVDHFKSSGPSDHWFSFSGSGYVRFLGGVEYLPYCNCVMGLV